MLTREAVGQVLRGIRKAKGLKLEDVAIPAGIDAPNLSRIERGLQGDSFETLGAIADVLETRASEICAIAEGRSHRDWRHKARTLMREKHITQEELIPIFGVNTRGAVGHHLRGRNNTTVEQFLALAKRLGVPAEELLGSEEPAQD